MKSVWNKEKYDKVQDLLNERDKAEEKANPATETAKPKLSKHTTMVATAKVNKCSLLK